MDDEIYACLIDYSLENSKQDISPLSVSKTIRRLLTSELTRLNYYPMAQKKKEELQLRSLIRERESKKVNERNDPFLLMMQQRQQQEIVAR
jgi:hypothetical protein